MRSTRGDSTWKDCMPQKLPQAVSTSKNRAGSGVQASSLDASQNISLLSAGRTRAHLSLLLFHTRFIFLEVCCVEYAQFKGSPTTRQAMAKGDGCRSSCLVVQCFCGANTSRIRELFFFQITVKLSATWFEDLHPSSPGVLVNQGQIEYLHNGYFTSKRIKCTIYKADILIFITIIDVRNKNRGCQGNKKIMQLKEMSVQACSKNKLKEVRIKMKSQRTEKYRCRSAEWIGKLVVVEVMWLFLGWCQQWWTW